MIGAKRKKNEGSILTFTLLNYEMSSGFAQVQVSFHYQGKQLCGFEKGIFVVVVVMLFFFFFVGAICKTNNE